MTQSSDMDTDRVATPMAFPAPGTFGVTERITLLCQTPGAQIHYTTDGQAPTAASPLFDPYKLPVVEALNECDKGITRTYTIRAVAVKAGLPDSEVATFNYTIERRDRGMYISREVGPGVWMILDFDDTKMVLILGSQRALLIDAGMGGGDLRGYVEARIGRLPLDVLITHAHPDHIACMGQFQGRYDVYMHLADLPMVKNFVEQRGYAIDPVAIKDIREGFVFDLGDRRLRVYEVPGHTDGCLALLDEANGILFSGDAVGSNRATITDSLWMQHKGKMPIDIYLSSLQVFRAKVRGKIKLIYTGHNDEPLYGEAYLDNLQQAAQELADKGTDVLVPSLRPTDVWQVVAGERLTDPNWAAINVSKDQCLSAAPDKIATLSNLQISGSSQMSGAVLDAGFSPTHCDYRATAGDGVEKVEITATTTSSRYAGLTINGVGVKSGVAWPADVAVGDNPFELVVTAPDGVTSRAYHLVIHRAR